MAENIEIIKSQRSLLDRSKSKHFDKYRVAAYCRVSTDSEEQLTSYKSQVSYYQKMISEKEDWELVDIYADEAITGTLTDKREGFQRLINDCMNGAIDIVVTKSISRFARNTLDTLQYVRMLKAKNIAVMFEEEKINTLTMDGELLLVVLSSVAQQEVENISANVKKGLKMKMQRGELVGYNGCLGYDYHKDDKSLTINEEGAKIVRYIFDRYVNGYGASVIARELMEMGVVGIRGNAFWHDSTVRGIIKNEKYIGDLLMGKTFTVDPITKRRLDNMGEEDKVYIRDHHEPIISKAVFYKAQEIMKGRIGSRILGEAFNRKKYSRQFSFSSMLKCGYCGNSLSRRAWNSGSEYGKVIWQCVVHTGRGSRYCPNSKGIEEKMVENAFLESYKLISKDNQGVLDEFLGRLTDTLAKSKRKIPSLDKFTAERNVLKQRKSKLLDSMLDGDIEKSIYNEKQKELDDSLQELEYKIKSCRNEMNEATDFEERIAKFRSLVNENADIEEFDRAVFESLIEYILVGGYDDEGCPDPYILTLVYKTGVCSNSSAVESLKREKIIVSEEYADKNYTDQVGNRLNELPRMTEIFDFTVPFRHIVFNKNDEGIIHKKIKNDCQVRVAIAV